MNLKLLISEEYYYIDLLKGDKTPWKNWYQAGWSWTWQTSGNPFPADDAYQNWNDPQWDMFLIYVKVKVQIPPAHSTFPLTMVLHIFIYLHLQEAKAKDQKCSYLYPDYSDGGTDIIGIDTYKSCSKYKAFCQLE